MIDTVRLAVGVLEEANLPAAGYQPADLSPENLPSVTVEVTASQIQTPFGLDTLTLTAYAAGRSEALSLLSGCIDALDERCGVFDTAFGCVDRFNASTGPTLIPFSDSITTATCQVLAEYRV